MEKITRNNYEIYFLDYYEGNLSAEKQAELFLFLEKHPDLRNEFEGFEMEPLPSVDISFDEKENLKRGIITKANYQHYLIAKIEGDLTKDELHELNKFLFQHPEYKKEEKLFEYTKLAPELISFPRKLNLKKAVPITERNKAVYISIAAACLLLLVGVYFLRNHSNESMQANRETKNTNSPITKNNNNLENLSHGESENKKLPVKKENPAPVELSAKSKNAYADNVNTEKNKKQDSPKKNKIEKTFVEKKINSRTFETIDLIERKEVAQVETKEVPQQQIAYININLLKQELNNATALNSYLDNVTDSRAKRDTENNTTNSMHDKQEQKPLLNLFAWVLNTFSKKDVTLKKSYNADGEMVAYQLESGKFKIGKSSSR